MNSRTIAWLGIATCSVALLGISWSTTVRSQINAAPSWVPIGVAQSGTQSTVWFHEQSTRQALACQTVGNGAGSSIHCVATRLP